MRLLESKKGLSFFAFEHNEEYQQAQHKFLVAVESMEPNNIVVRNPAAPDGQRSSGVLCLGQLPLWCGEACLRAAASPKNGRCLCAEQSDLRGEPHSALSSLLRTVCRALWGLSPAVFAFSLGDTAVGMRDSLLQVPCAFCAPAACVLSTPSAPSVGHSL